MVKRLVLLFFLFNTLLLNAQGLMDNAPPTMNWRQLRSPNFKFIYPASYGANIQKLANRMEAFYAPISEGLDASPKRIPIILQNRSSISNGFVTLSPRRSEFYTMPPQEYNFLGTNTWMELLSTHEFRHIVQFEKSKTGITKLARFVFGQNGQAALAAISVPRWFWEGDATLIETLYTPSGRGRFPDFNRVYRTNLLTKKSYSYNKQHLRSFKDFIPNHYVLGYNYVTHVRRRSGNREVWEKVTQQAFSRSIIPFTFSTALKRHTGKNIIQNYRAMEKDLKSKWSNQINELNPEEYVHLVNEPKVFTNYQYPQLLSNGNLVTVKTGLGDATQFVELKNGKEVDRYMMGIFNDPGFLSSAGNHIVWNEIFVDARYGKQSSSVIKTYDFKSGKRRTLTRNTRFTGAALSPDSSRVVTSETTINQLHSLIVLDFLSGDEVKRFVAPDNQYLSMARFSSDGRKIVALMTSEEGKGVVSFDYASGAMEVLIPVGYENIGHPVLHGNLLFFNSPYNGIDNIYVKDLSTNQRYAVTNSRYGAYNPAIDEVNKIIYFNDHQPMGMNIASIPFDQDSWVSMGEVPVSRVDYFKPLEYQERSYYMEDHEEEEYPTKNYSALLNIINPHSWGPLATSSLDEAQVGIFSEDLLQTTRIGAGYEYNINARTGVFFGELSYQGIFPVFDLRVERGERINMLSTTTGDIDYTWDETTAFAGVRLPLNLTRTRFFSQLEIGYRVGLRDINNFDNPELPDSQDFPNRIYPVNDSLAFFLLDRVDNGMLNFGNFHFSYFLLQKQSERDLNSRWGLSLDLESYSTFSKGNSDFEGNLVAFRGTAYLPSPVSLISRNIFKHHSLFIRYNYQHRGSELSPDLYYFQNRIFKPRGYGYTNFESFQTFSANYKFPLLYPDLGIGPFIYLKRAKLNLFYDYGIGRGKNYFLFYDRNSSTVYQSILDDTFFSVGGELTFDLNIMRFPANIDLGVRFAYTLDTQISTFDFLLMNIDF